MVAAIVIAAKHVSAPLSQRVAMRLQSFRLLKAFSTLWRCLYNVLQYLARFLRFARGGMQEAIPLVLSVARNSSLSYPLSPIGVPAFGNPG